MLIPILIPNLCLGEASSPASRRATNHADVDAELHGGDERQGGGQL
jgi:hypothetical protein